MEMLKANKGVLTVAVIVIVALFAYNSFSSSITFDPSSDNMGQDLIKIANSLSQANLNRALFTQSGYRLLNDFTVPLVPEPLGRLNPFAPIGQ